MACRGSRRVAVIYSGRLAELGRGGGREGERRRGGKGGGVGVREREKGAATLPLRGARPPADPPPVCARGRGRKEKRKKRGKKNLSSGRILSPSYSLRLRRKGKKYFLLRATANQKIETKFSTGPPPLLQGPSLFLFALLLQRIG